jgi:hypothetical protein
MARRVPATEEFALGGSGRAATMRPLARLRVCIDDGAMMFPVAPFLPVSSLDIFTALG